ncbi:uncharacterized protein LOC131664497 isoform X2 [Phymastichus coffea]|uniref:uncharacterized protein LOC131664497 isoform X2 n=1 Tax=Phymastichus coffea TaxID=108790 RepID=UPI00273AF3E4|nr:uncharacterized protein LOC131664497 isoform X2 [Phymastichus coffea]
MTSTMSAMELLAKEHNEKAAMQNSVSRQDSGMPGDEELCSPIDCLAESANVTLNISESVSSTINDSNTTLDSECNITVIHVPPANDKSIDKSVLITGNGDEGTPVAENDKKDEGKDSKDGSDSGVEGCAVEIPREQRRNSADYESSCNGEASCDSSLASCCSVYEDPCATLPDDIRLNIEPANDSYVVVVAPVANGSGGGGGGGSGGGGEGTSEAGSESSSLAGSISARVQTRRDNANGGPIKKRITTHGSFDSQKSQRPSRPSMSSIVNGTTATGARAKPKTTTQRNTLGKSQSLSSKDRGRSREKSVITPSKEIIECKTRDSSLSGVRGSSVTRSANSCMASTAASRSRARPDSLPSALMTEINKDLAQRGRGVATRPRGGSTTRTSTMSTRTPSSTPSEDGRKSLSSAHRSTSLYAGRLDLKSARIFDKMTSSVDGVKALDTYGTLPRSARQGKFSIPKTSDKPPVSSRSRSGSRDASLNRLLGRKAVNNSKEKGLPPYPKLAEKTKIYHETCSQTGLTGKDIDNCLAGVVTIIPNPESVDTLEGESQTEGSWEDIKRLKEELKTTTEEKNTMNLENEKMKAELEDLRKKLVEEKADHAFARQELDKNAQRVLAMLGTPQSEHTGGSDSFLELESHIQSSGQVVASQQVEIADLQSLCRMLSRDLEKSLAAQKALLQQQQELEAESIEMQDFLQEEKATLETALKEAEIESKKKDEKVKQLTSELEQQTEECKHLVRISEQRRQENLSLSMKLSAVERRSKELLLAQGAAASGASVALSGLGSRLEALVDQLIMSYNISQKDLEDVIFHNEAFSRSNSSVESSPVSSKHSLKDCTPSPKRNSFVSAVIGAIKNAATHPFATKQTNDKKSADSSKAIQKDLSLESSSDILDFETEPCLMMESVLEDVPLPDTYSHNMVSSCDSLRRVISVPEAVDESNLRKTKMHGESSSLTNLSQAILNRRKVEDEEEDICESVSESEIGPSECPLPLTDYCPTTSLVDQVIDVDNLVTKLLKVLRIIQLDNDTCIQELKDEKAELEMRLEIYLAERKAVESGQDYDKENMSYGINDQTVVIENCKHVISELTNTKELIDDGQMEKSMYISEESRNESQNANPTILLSSRVQKRHINELKKKDCNVIVSAKYKQNASDQMGSCI